MNVPVESEARLDKDGLWVLCSEDDCGERIAPVIEAPEQGMARLVLFGPGWTYWAPRPPGRTKQLGVPIPTWMLFRMTGLWVETKHARDLRQHGQTLAFRRQPEREGPLIGSERVKTTFGHAVAQFPARALCPNRRHRPRRILVLDKAALRVESADFLQLRDPSEMAFVTFGVNYPWEIHHGA